MNKLIWHNINEKPDRNLKLVIVENLPFDGNTREINGYYDGENFIYNGCVIRDALLWAYDTIID